MLVPVLLFCLGLMLLIRSGGQFVEQAAAIAHRLRMPQALIGATVVSLGTTLPEVMVSAGSALGGHGEIAYGNAVGSVTANVGLIMCVALICMECAMTRKQFGVKACLLLAAILALFGFTRDGQLSVLESVLILIIFVGFLVESLIAARQEQGSELPAQEERPKIDKKTVLLNIGKFLLGAAGIVLGAQLLIDNGSALARMLGVPDAVIAATMIAIGTSLPELVTTLTAIKKKQASLSVGNIIGANIMDLTLIMPLCAVIQGKPMTVERQGMLLDIPACLIICAAALIPALVQGKFKRWIGYLIGGLYIAYLIIMFTCFGA